MKVWFERIVATSPADGWLALFRNEEDKSFSTQRLAVWATLRSEVDAEEDDYFGVIGLGVATKHLDPIAEAPNFERYIHERDLAGFAQKNLEYRVFLPGGESI
jgi:hypothetical protein